MAAAEVVPEVLPQPPPPPPPREPAAALRHFSVPKVVLYLYFASAWVGCACLAAGAVVARRALGVDSPVVYALIKASIGSFAFPALVLVVVTLRLLRAMCAAGFGSSLRTSAREIQIQSRKMFGGLTWKKVLRHPAVLVVLAYFLLFLLLIAGTLMLWGLLPVKESQREKIGYALLDTGVLGTMSICCFIIIPTYVLKVWRSK
ncbi:unnamed protein product [Urochloa humidicola]